MEEVTLKFNLIELLAQSQKAEKKKASKAAQLETMAPAHEAELEYLQWAQFPELYN